MSFWDSLLAFFRLPPPQKRRSFALDEQLAASIQELAAWEQRPPEEVANDLLAEALYHRQVTEGSRILWNILSRREREVTALICLDFTTAEAAARLSITRETTKTHVAHVLDKAGLHSRTDLRRLFTGWDFSSLR